MKTIRPIAIHLPQFHPIPENDAWWGKGFTEWTNVAKALPKFPGHYQPHVPADLGFYDLRLEESRVAQAQLAREYGIYGFCFYHYWFNGQRLLQRPLDDMIKTQTPDFPFMLCWANENWTRRWDGFENEILMKQDYSTEDDLKHIRFLCEHFFSDARYIRVNNKPFFTVYRPQLFPDFRKTVDTWRNESIRLGIGDLYIGYTQSFNLKVPAESLGIDAAIEFHPDFSDMPPRRPPSISERISKRLGLKKTNDTGDWIVDYGNYVARMLARKSTHSRIFPGITPMWDNSARKKKGAFIFTDSSPELYKKWLEHIRHTFVPFSDQENFIFINAWNEWAEGNHLEPCLRWGRGYLEATKEALQ